MKLTSKRIYKAMKANGIPSLCNYRGIVTISKCEGKYEIRESESNLAVFVNFLRLPFDALQDGFANAWTFFRNGCTGTYTRRITDEQAKTLLKMARG